MKTQKNQLFNKAAALLAVSLTAVSLANAAPRTWSGGGADNNWSTAANWGGTAPVNLDSLIFAGSTRVTNLNNIAPFSISGITFNNSGFLFGGNVITNSGGVYDNAGNNTNNLITFLNGSQGFTNAVASTVLQFGGVQTNMGTANVITYGGDGNIFINGVINGNVAGINKEGNGTLRLNAANTFNGPLTINAGTVQLANAGGIPSGTGNRCDVTNNGTLDINGLSPTINGLYGSGVVDNKAGAATYTLTVGATNNGPAFTFSGTIQNTSGLLALTKTGTNTFNFTGTDSHSGPTIVNAGKLVLGASTTLPNTPSINLFPGTLLDASAGGTLTIGAAQQIFAGRTTNGGPADIAGTVDLSGRLGVLNPSLIGGSTVAGTLGINGGLTLQAGSLLTLDLGSTNTAGAGSNDLVSINGPLTLNGGTVQINPYAGSLATGVNGTYTLVTNATTTVSGSAANLSVAVPRGITATLNDSSFPGSLLVAITGSGTPVSLVWNGASGANWDVQTSQNWLSNSVPDYFYYLDNVVLNDVGNGTVSIPAGVSPGSTLFNNSSTNAYVLSGAGSISGSGALTVNGGGSVTLNTLNNYTGDTVVNYGQLLLGNYNTGTFINNIVVYNGVSPANLVLGNGGTYQVGVANTHEITIFNLLTLKPGGSSVAMRNRQSNATPYYQFGSVSRNVGSTADFSNIQQRGGSKVGVYFTGQTFPSAGILGGYATYGLNDWCGTNISTFGTSLTNCKSYLADNTPANWTATTNVSLSGSTAANINNTTIYSLRVTAAATATINAGQTLTVSSGGILIPNNGTGAATITGGTLVGGSGADLIVHENSSANSLTIASTIADTGGACGLTKAGMGTLILSGANTYSGATFINGATIAGGSGATPGANAAGILQVGAGGTSGDLGSTPGVTNFGTLAFNRSDNITLNVPVSGIGVLRQSGAGVLTVTSANTYSGPTAVTAGTLQVGAGGTAGDLGNSSRITNNATLVFNRSDAVSFNGPISGSGAVVKMGGSSLSLASSNSYAGLTIVSNGSVVLGANASISQSAGIVLAAGGSKLNVTAPGSIALTGGSIAQVLAGIGSVDGSVVVTNNTRVTPGTNNLVGTLTITNGLTVDGGTLNIDAGSSTRDLINVGGTLALNSGSLVLKTLNTIPNGTYKIIGYNSFSGDTANLAFSGFSQAGQLAYITNNATAKEIDLVVLSGAGAALTWVGDGVNNFWDVNTTSDWDNGAGSSTFHNNDNVTLNDSSIYPTVNVNANVSPATVTINTLVNNYTFEGSGKITGGAALAINATNTTVTIKTPNDNSGASTINTGTVQVGDGTTGGNIGIGAVTNKGVINFNEPADTTVSASLIGNGSVFQQGATTLTLSGDNSAFSGPVTISAGVVNIGGGTASGSIGSGLITNNGVLLVERTGTLAVNNSITGTGPVIFNGGGTVTFGGNNTYANNTYVSNGVVKAGSATAIPNDAGAGNWLVLDGNANGGTFDLNGNNISVNGLQGLNGTVNGIIQNNAAGTTNKLIVNGTAATAFSGTIRDNSGSGGKVALVKDGTGTQTLDIESVGGNTYSGGTVISNGILRVITSNANGTTANFPNANAVALGSGPVTFYGGVLSLAGSIPQGNGPTFNAGPANSFIVPANQSGLVNPPQRGGTAFNLSGSGTFTYIAAYVRGSMGGNWSAFTGQVYFTATNNGGNLGIDSITGIPNAHVLFTNVLGFGVNLYNRVGGTPTIPYGEIAGDSAHQISGTEAGNNNGALAANFAVGGLNTSTNFDGAIIDNVGIIKVGSGVWTLNGLGVGGLSYTGSTVVSNGVLALGASAAITASSPITIASAGVIDVSAGGTMTLAAQTLQGTGTLRGSLNAGSGSTVSPGGVNGIGTLTVTNAVTLGGTVIMELNRTNNTSATNDMLVAAAVAAGGTLQVNNIGSDLHTGDTFKLFSVPVTGAFAVTNLPVTTGNGSITYVWTNKVEIDGTIQVLVGVPNVNLTPTNLTTVVNGGNIELSWPADHTGWRLQAQTNSLSTGLSGNWVDVAGTAADNHYTNTINAVNGSVFYRMVYP